MVSAGVAETRNEPEYSLDGVHRMAAFQQVRFMSRRLQTHLDRLEYGLENVCDRLSELSRSHFHRSERYQDDNRWHDVYLLPHPVPGNPGARLYIKFRVSRDCVWIELCSCHPEGWS